MHGVLLTLAYDGTGFSGWAAQTGRRTIEETLAGAIGALDPKATAPRGTSRTDAGVHADGQLAAFDATLAIPPRGWVLALNQHLPDDACVRSARPIAPGYNPRFASRSKLYRYTVLLDRVRDPRLRSRAWRIGWPIDMAKLEREARAIEGRHDFSAFRSVHDERSETVRTMHRVGVELSSHGHSASRLVSILIEGDGFLHNMVRILVGTLMDVARGKLDEGTIARTLGEGAALGRAGRARLGMTAPAHGLSLERVNIDLPEGAGEPWPQQ
jgi:tRNA pseudouridine38-40 synthase